MFTRLLGSAAPGNPCGSPKPPPAGESPNTPVFTSIGRTGPESGTLRFGITAACSTLGTSTGRTSTGLAFSTTGAIRGAISLGACCGTGCGAGVGRGFGRTGCGLAFGISIIGPAKGITLYSIVVISFSGMKIWRSTSTTTMLTCVNVLVARARQFVCLSGSMSRRAPMGFSPINFCQESGSRGGRGGAAPKRISAPLLEKFLFANGVRVLVLIWVSPAFESYGEEIPVLRSSPPRSQHFPCRALAKRPRPTYQYRHQRPSRISLVLTVCHISRRCIKRNTAQAGKGKGVLL